MERSEAKAELKRSPAGLNNTRQNAVGHPSPRFSNRREIVTSAGERKTDREAKGSRRDFCLSARR